MLLQRASAGSGKTFKLAKTYIRLFISTLEEGSGRYRLLTPAEVRDSHSHILGVTFTNKATNEMKQRIVEKLAALASPVPAEGMEPAGYEFPDYMLDFTGEADTADPVHDVLYTAAGTPARRADITATCRAAIHALLNDYGNFNISTIDSFFQGVLRTLTYELHLDDSYHVELNDDFLAQTGVDETLSAVKESRPDEGEPGYMYTWLRSIMGRRLEQGDNWNAFTQGANSGIYGEMLALAKKMKGEAFKRHLDAMEDYFGDGERFHRFYEAAVRTSGCVKELHSKCRKAASVFRKSTNPDSYSRGVQTTLNEITFSTPFSKVASKAIVEKNRSDYAGKRTNPFKAKTDEAGNPALQALFTEVCDTLCAWQEARQYWNTVLSRLNYMGTLFYINSHIERFRRLNNIIPLSETNDILHKIINNDEVPFIYERTGVRLHHFLLDEFQDTSLLQWSNLRPLLEQSDSYGHDNLIIGDAKQSIYRFRNAAPELISGGVQADFPHTRVLPNPDDAGTPAYDAVNTNWRSAMHVVDFNNHTFTALAALLDADPLSQVPGRECGRYFADLYANTVQAIRKKDTPGYVRVDFAAKNGFDTLGVLIDDLRDRGFALHDIAILTDTAADGRKAIASIISHNESMQGWEGYTPIEFISEESLLVGEAAAVKIILSVLNIIAHDFITPPHEEQGDNGLKEGDTPKSHRMRHYELQRLVANYNIGLWNKSVSSPEQADCSETIISYEELAALYRRMGAVTLPAMVECVAASFLPEELQTSQAAYMAAFQDIVLSYCDTYPSDIASFLNWWEDNGKNLCIAAPDGIDAVQVMTVHKSKGLEFKAVILPDADWPLGPKASKEHLEVIWAHMVPRGLTDEEMKDAPPCIPVTPHGESMHRPDSPFFADYHEFFMQSRTDQLNKTYVAFTRAVRELHIFAPTTKNGSPQLGNLLRAAVDGMASAQAVQDRDTFRFDGDVMEYGNPVDLEAEKRQKEEPGKTRLDPCEPSIIEIERYSPAVAGRTPNALFSLDDDI